MISDIDGSQIQLYTLNNKNSSVHNSNYIDAVYIKSELSLNNILTNRSNCELRAVFLYQFSRGESVKVKVIKAFIDREAVMKHRKIGDEFEADGQRAKYLETFKFVKAIEFKLVRSSAHNGST